MKTSQYGRQEQAIAAADSGGIWQQWLYGLRLINDAERLAPAGGLRHGEAEKLIAEAERHGIKLSEREIRWRMQCARAYPTEAQIGNAVTDLRTWRAMTQAGFPPYERPEGEPDADYRTAKEARHDRARDLARAAAEHASAQLELFPAAHLDPARSTLADLEAYVVEQAEMTARFAKRDAERRAHLDKLIEAAGGDMDMLWQEAHNRLASPPIPLAA